MSPEDYHQAKIVATINETTDAKTFVLLPLQGWLPEYKSGQFLTLVFHTRLGEKRRSYSISSSPALGEPLSITVKKIENGEFSRLLHSHAKVGDILHVSGIGGFFLLPDDLSTTEQVVFLAAGSGITPCFSLIKTLLKTTTTQVALIYSNRTAADTIFKMQLFLLQKQYAGRFRITFLQSNSLNIKEGRLSNWLLLQLLQTQLKAPLKNVLVYTCGPFEYMQMVTITLLSEGMPAKNIRKENFDWLPRIVKPVPPDTKAHAVTIHLNGNVYTINVQYPQTVLAVAKSQNIPIPYSCEAGRCGSCAATCTNGKFWLAYNEVLMDDELAKGRILCCQAYPVWGDAEITV